MRRGPRTDAQQALRKALDGVLIDGLRLAYDDFNHWTLRGDKNEIVVSSKTIEGLDTNLANRRKAIKKLPFTRVKVIVVPRYGEPWVGTVTSRPGENCFWVVNSDNSAKKEQIDTVRWGREVKICAYTDEAFEKICDIKMAKMDHDRKHVQAITALKESLSAWVPDDKAQPVIENA
jgi:hypothetical protein